MPGVKLTKPGDTLEGSVYRAHDYLSKHCDHIFNIVSLAGTNDLRKRKIIPKFLLEALDDSINELKSFGNLQDVFVVKLPPRCDIASVNHKVNIYNQLLDDHFANNILNRYQSLGLFPSKTGHCVWIRTVSI